MANYTIIGGDGKEYGPVTDVDVRLWIAEGRLNEESRAKAESDAEFRNLAQFPEFAEVLRAQATPGTISPISPPGARQVPRAGGQIPNDYELDIGGCISRAWDLLKDHFGILVGSFVLMFLMNIACGGAMGLVTVPFAKSLAHSPAWVQVGFNYFFSLAIQLVAGPLMGGLYLIYLKAIRGQNANVSDLFAGFQQAYVPLFLGSVAVALIINTVTLPAKYVWQVKFGPVQEMLDKVSSDPSVAQQILPKLMEAMAGSLPVFLICLVPATFVAVTLGFTVPLIMDKSMGAGEAMKASIKMVMKHFWQVFGLVVVVGIVTVLGVLGCCIGFFFTAPIGIAAMMYAYETIFSDQRD